MYHAPNKQRVELSLVKYSLQSTFSLPLWSVVDCSDWAPKTYCFCCKRYPSFGDSVEIISISMFAVVYLIYYLVSFTSNFSFINSKFGHNIASINKNLPIVFRLWAIELKIKRNLCYLIIYSIYLFFTLNKTLPFQEGYGLLTFIIKATDCLWRYLDTSHFSLSTYPIHSLGFV